MKFSAHGSKVSRGIASAVGVLLMATGARAADSVLVAWGFNAHGQCTVPSDLGVVIQISAGEAFTAALRADGTVRCWGDNSMGQLNIPADATSGRQINCGYNGTVMLRSDGTVRC